MVAAGYLTEARLFARNIYESLTQAMAFVGDESLAEKFYQGRQVSPTAIQRSLSASLAVAEEDKKDVYKQLKEHYRTLSTGAHPTLDSFKMRTAAKEAGSAGLRKAVPEDVVFGGLLQDDIGRISWLGLARSVVDGLAAVSFVLHDATGNWERRYYDYRDLVEKQKAEDDARFDEI